MCCEEETSAGLAPFLGLPTIRPALDSLQCLKYEGGEGGERGGEGGMVHFILCVTSLVK